MSTTRVSSDLAAILNLNIDLRDQAIHDANSRDLPGGNALVALAPVASPETWGNRLDGAERLALAYGSKAPEVIEAEEMIWEPPLQTLLFWSEAWRETLGYPLEDRRPTIATEAAFLRSKAVLDWAWDNELHFDDFARDVAMARTRLEDVLHDGLRVAMRGVPCMYDECRGKRLIRKTVPTRDKDGSKIWKLTDWHCPACKRSWKPEEYTANIYAAVERQHYAEVADDTWCTISRAARIVGRREHEIAKWAERGDVAAVCLIDDARKWTFVLRADVMDRHQLACERAQTRREAMARKSGAPM